MKDPGYCSNMYRLIENRVKDKDVLDVGCVAHSIDFSNNPNWLHGFICRNAKSTLGIDILEREINILRQRGFNVVCGNAETSIFPKKFDIIVAGDVIGQLSNMGLFLDNMYKHLNDDGKIIITTANAKCWWVLKQLFLGSRDFLKAPHLVSLYNAHTLSHILRKHNFELEEAYYYDSRNLFLFRYFPSISDTIIVIARKKIG